ncbi:MAG TPA: ATP-grasp domain-containing protein [Gaiellaceae bacterium]|jgi:carbamoyl-phosphate synthase large subunit
MRPVAVLVTAVGAPGAAALLRHLRENGEREVRIVGCDMNPLSIGRFVCDAFHTVPAGSDPSFADAVLDVCRAERVDIVLPESSNDLMELALAKERFASEGFPVMVSPPEGIRRANDKAEFLELLDELGVPAPAWRRVSTAAEFSRAAEELGYPEESVCFKPAVEKGGRGFRILDPTVDRAHQLLHERPGALAMRLEDVLEVLPEDFGEELLVMEFLRGTEKAIDGIAENGRVLLAHPKTREAIRAGLAMYFRTLDDENLLEIARKIVGGLGLDHFFSVNLVGDVVIELNPRISTWVYQDDLNMPYLGLKHALGEVSADELAAEFERVRPTRRALRYFDQVEWDEPK